MEAGQSSGSVLATIPAAKAQVNERCEYSTAGQNIDSLGVNNPTTKSEVICDIIRAYQHDYEAEGDSISKRRLWYILKPVFARIPSYKAAKTDKKNNVMLDKNGNEIEVRYFKNITHQNRPVLTVNNADFSKEFNILAKNGEVDDTFISDNSRSLRVGRLLPMIVLAVEKSTVDTAVLKLADDLGISCYIAKGFSSIYAAKKLKQQILETLDIEPYELTKEIISEPEWYYKYSPEPTSTNLVVLNMTDLDKSGIEISNTIDDHFSADEAYRVLLQLSQVPDDKVDEYFDTNADGSRAYELDILNMHQLRDIFLDAMPEHIANIIIEKRQQDINLQKRDRLVPDAIDEDDAVVFIQETIDDLEFERDNIQKEYLEKIEKIEKLMADASKNVDSLIEDEDENLLKMKLKLFPHYLKKYDDNEVITFADTTVKNIADGISMRINIDYSWAS